MKSCLFSICDNVVHHADEDFCLECRRFLNVVGIRKSLVSELFKHTQRERVAALATPAPLNTVFPVKALH